MNSVFSNEDSGEFFSDDKKRKISSKTMTKKQEEMYEFKSRSEVKSNSKKASGQQKGAGG